MNQASVLQPDTAPAPAPATPLVPPRPNLGTEPWDGGGATSGPVTMGGVGLALVAALAVAAILVRRGRSGAGNLREPTTAEVETIEVDPRVEAADAVRAALVERFGAGWRSRTTEEVAADPDLARRLGPDRLAEVAALLRRGDQAKFAATPSDEGSDINGVPAPVASLVAALVAASQVPGPPAARSGRVRPRGWFSRARRG